MKQQQDIAILLFSRSAKPEANSKKWTNNPELDYQIACHLIDRVKNQLESAPFPVFHIDESQQSGESFEQRITNSFHQIFRKGYQYVIAVGNDNENLHINWETAASGLRHQKSILGPDERGGVYLLGISMDTDYETIFKGISWNSSKVFNQLRLCFKNSFILESRRDINHLQDVNLDQELRCLLVTFFTEKQFLHIGLNIISYFIFLYNPLRAPPC